MVKRRVSTEKYIAAFFITFLIFSLGIILGLLIEEKRVGFLDGKYKEHSVEFMSSQLQYDYLSQLGEENEDFCEVVNSALNGNLINLDKTRVKLISYSQDSKISQEDFDLLKREYSLEELRYWMLSKKLLKKCPGNPTARILYFYSNDNNCPKCAKEEFILNYLKSIYSDKVLIFSLDESLEEPFIKIIKEQYNISHYPGIIFEDRKMKLGDDGYVNLDRLKKGVCSLDGSC